MKRRLDLFLLLLLLPVGCRTWDAPVAATDILRVASLMFQPVKWDKEGNCRKLAEMIRQASRAGADLIVTPEGALEGYVVNKVIRAKGSERSRLTARFRRLAESARGSRIRFFQDLAQSEGVHLIVGFLEADGEETYNTALLIRPDGTCGGKYRKTHFAQGFVQGNKKGENPPGYTRGTTYPVFPLAGRQIGIMICYDRRVPQVAERLKKNGAELIINPAYGMKGDCNRRFITARVRETGLPILFVHPNQTLFCDSQGRITRDVRPKSGDPRIDIVTVVYPPR